MDTDNRFTSSDRETLNERVRAAAVDWNTVGWPWKFTPAHTETLVRLGAHSIGCTLDDLRDVEVAEIRSMVDSITMEITS